MIKRLKFLPFYLVSLLPYPIVYLLSDIGYFVLYRIVRYRRKVVPKNLKIAFPNKTDKERNDIEKKFYRQFCDIMLETGKLLTISKNQAINRYKVTNPELIQKYYDEGRNVLVYAAHTGNWEWYSTFPLHVPHQCISLYQPLSNKYFNSLTHAMRERFGSILVESSKGYRKIMEYSAKNILTHNLVIGDQRPGKNSPKHDTTFFGRNTSFLIGADRIAKKSDQVVVYPRVSLIKRGYYTIEFITITENAKSFEGHEIIDQYANLLEESIRRSPHLWLWSHNRWKNQQKANPTEEKSEPKKMAVKQ